MKTNTKKRIVFYTLLAFVVAFLFLSQKGKERLFSATYTDYLDTVCDISVYSHSSESLKDCEDYLKFAEKEFSAEDEYSTLYDYNHFHKKQLSDDLSDLISKGKEFSEKYSEYFSIYLDELINLWDITSNPGRIPESIKIESALNSQNINLGGIAKGYITDKLIQKLRESNVKSALINLGGNTYAMGKKPTGENWKIGIQSPKDENILVGSITAENLAVVTSGDYQRYAEIDGKNYHHIFDPKTGFPAESGVRSVTVICENATLADVLSTTVFVAGVEDGNKILKENGAMGVFVTDDTVYFSKELENIFRQMDFSYKYEFLY